MYALVILVISIIVTVKICKVINQNTIGTTKAYFVRGIVIWAVVFMLLTWLWAKITGQA